jgi:hypothetical protein
MNQSRSLKQIEAAEGDSGYVDREGADAQKACLEVAGSMLWGIKSLAKERHITTASKNKNKHP